ncbi:hypothetical protein A2U01_0082997, partial [Trifolium medium]|nr:hypothetical protein [Trifolium medium]
MEKTAKSCKFFVCPGRNAPGARQWAQGASSCSNVLFMFCFLRNARVGLRIAQ